MTLDGFLKARWSRWAVSLLAMTVIVATIGPFDTFDRLSLINRFAYWLGVIVTASSQWLVMAWVLRRLVETERPWPDIAVDIITAFLVAIPLAYELELANAWLFGNTPTYAEMYLSVALTGALVCGSFHLFRTLVRAEVPTDEAGPSTDTSPFLDRIPAKITGELLCVKTEDHYLRLYTSAGEDLILFRMKDAVRELQTENGLQVHRSFWVARGAVADVSKESNKLTLILKNGIRVPVSNTYAPTVRRAGWVG